MFMTKDATKLSMVGFAGDFFGTGDRQLYMNPDDDLIRFPANYNDSYTDTSIQMFSFPGSDLGIPVDSIVNKRETIKDVTIDGWGELTTPMGTFPVLRLNQVTRAWDSTWAYSFGFPQLADNSTDTSYSVAFWSNDPATGFPLAELSHDGMGTIYSVEWLNSSPTMDVGVLENSNIIVYPNPAVNEIQVSIEDGAVATLVVYDLNGRQVLTSGVTNSTSVDVSELNSGSYIYSLIEEENEISKGNLVIKR